MLEGILPGRGGRAVHLMEYMDPISAFANLVTALTKLVTVMVEGQTPEQKKQMWDFYISDVKAWRKLFGIQE